MRGQGRASTTPKAEGPQSLDAVVLDTSALMAILLGEPESAACAAVLGSEARLLISAGTLAEALIVAGNRGIGTEMTALVAEGGVEVVPVTATTAARVAEAHAAWGRGHHPAGLNFGDCFAYALVHEKSYPLLYVGQDFAKTNVPADVQGPAQRTL